MARKSPSVTEWKGRYHVARDACSKFVDGAERVGWESLLDMKSNNLKGGCQNTWEQ